MAKTSSNVIRYLIAEKGLARKDLAQALQTTMPGLANKFTRGSFDWHDLTVVAAACGVRLAFVDNNNKIVAEFPAPAAQTNK